jgi:outer membrane protein assembly factor BamB
MIFNNLVRTSLFLASAASVLAQDLLPTPVQLWTYQLLPQTDLGSVNIQKGNGVFLDADGKMAVVTTVGATVYAFSAYSGKELWHYQAPYAENSITSCHSAVTFSPSATFMAFSVVDNENALTPTT